MKRKKTTKKKKLAERVAYNLRFSLIRLNYKAKMQLYEAKQAKRVVIEPINTPRTKKINGSFFGFRNLGEGLCDEWVLSASVCVARSPVDFCYATTEAERRPLVVSVPIPLRTQLVGTPTRRKIFLRNYGKQKKCQRTLDTNTHPHHLASPRIK